MHDKQDGERDFLNRVREQLEQAEVGLDMETRRALRLARYRALAQLPKPRQRWQPLGLAAAVAVSVAALAIGLPVLLTSTGEPVSGVEDIQLLSTSDDLDLYENLEFYQWLEFEARSG